MYVFKKNVSVNKKIAITLLLLFAASIFRYLLTPLLDDYLPYTSFWIASYLIYRLIGLKWAIFALFLSLFLADFFFIKPIFSFAIYDSFDLMRLILKFFIGVSFLLLADWLKRGFQTQY